MLNLHQKIIKLLKIKNYLAKDASEESFPPEYVRAYQTFCYDKGGKFAMYATKFPTEEILPLEVKTEIDNMIAKKSVAKKIEKSVEKIVIEKKEEKKEEKVENVENTAPVSVEPVKEEKTGFFFKKNKNKKK